MDIWWLMHAPLSLENVNENGKRDAVKMLIICDINRKLSEATIKPSI